MMEKIDQAAKRALLYFGYGFQVPKAIEELGELTAALGKGFNGGFDKQIIDEIADVTIMIRQLRLIYGQEKVDERIKFKLERLSERMSDDYRAPYIQEHPEENES